MDSLEKRVCRLEDALANIQDTKAIEERIVERVAQRVNKSIESRASTGVMLEAGRSLLPAAATLIKAGADAAAKGNGGPRQAWLFYDVYHEVRAMIRMFSDRSFRVSWAARLVLPMAILLMVVSWLWIGSVPFIGPLLDRITDILLAFITYKVLSREAHRYRTTVSG